MGNAAAALAVLMLIDLSPRIGYAANASSIRVGVVAPLRSDIHLLDGRRLSFLSWGDVAKPVIVVLHGKGSSAAEMFAVAAALGDRYHVLVPDERGCGYSDWSRSGNYSVESMVDDLTQFVAALQLDRFGLYGASLGAVVGIAYAAEYPAHVSALFLEDGGPIALPDGSLPPLNKGQAHYAGAPSSRPLPRAYPSWSAMRERESAGVPQGVRTLVLESRFVRDERGAVAERNDIIGLWKSAPGNWFFHPWPLVRRIKARTLLVRGDRGLMPEPIAVAMTAANPLIRYQTVRNAAHSVRNDQPTLWRKLLTDFFKPRRSQ
jgi:2-succinyl-6-hydroxy-2,4-cyclohexadiene-1-carboxylate synthase